MTVAFSNKNSSYIVIRRWRNLSLLQSAENFENVCVMLQKIIEYLTAIKIYSVRIVIKFERDEGSFEIPFLCILLGVSVMSWSMPIMNH